MNRLIALSLATALTGVAIADEGMWTYDNFPSAVVQKQYGSRIDGPWLDRVRLSTVRLSGCTASFVSSEGLILTNHHCITACLTENSSKEKSLLEDGFLAGNREQELKCPTQIADVLVAMDNITDKLEAATRGLDDRAANDARKKALTELEQACEKDTGDKCQSVAPLQWRSIFSVPLQALHRYPPRLRSGSRHRRIRRRSG